MRLSPSLWSPPSRSKLRSKSTIPILPLFSTFILLLCTFAWGHSHRRSPISYISLVENPRISTPSQRIHAQSNFDITFALHKGTQEVKFSLEPNNDIIPSGAKVEYMDEHGNIARSELIKPHDVRVFKGTAWVRDEGETGWTNAGWARVVVKKDGESPLFTGAFVLNHDAHHIQLRSWYLKTRHELDPELEASGDEFMVVFRDSDVKGRLGGDRQIPLTARDLSLDESGSQCGADNLTLNMDPLQNPIFNMDIKARDGGLFGLDSLVPKSIKKRQNFDSTPDGGGFSGMTNLRNSIGDTRGCPSTKLVALVGVATDCTYTNEFNTEEEVRQHIISQFNSASILFESTFNITLGLQTLVISPKSCPGTAPATAPWNLPCSAADITQRLSLISEWRGTRADDKNAFWTLLTNCATGSSVGLAWVGMLCRETADQGTDGQWRSGANVVARTPTEWKVIAHEIGHTMGAVHDCTSDTCANQEMSLASMCCPLTQSQCDARGQFLMNPSTDDRIQNFSPCTVGNICSAFSTGSVSKACLSNNNNVQIITENRCGNGIVEQGEDCDCGGEEGCQGNTCCDAQSCTFIEEAVCDDSNDDCCSSCQFSSANTVCRPSNGRCDPEETCTGNTATCPEDVTKPDGESCGASLICASGQCTSRDMQCMLIMGVEAGTNDTVSCNDNSCTIECTTPAFGSGYCFGVQQNFLDGTPCNGDGKCRNGVCKGATALGEVKSWISRNKTLVIAVGAGVGGVILISILSCIIRRCCCNRRRGKKMPPNSPIVLPPPDMNMYQRPYPQNQYQAQQVYQERFQQQQQGHTGFSGQQQAGYTSPGGAGGYNGAGAGWNPQGGNENSNSRQGRGQSGERPGVERGASQRGSNSGGQSHYGGHRGYQNPPMPGLDGRQRSVRYA